MIFAAGTMEGQRARSDAIRSIRNSIVSLHVALPAIQAISRAPSSNVLHWSEPAIHTFPL